MFRRSGDVLARNEYVAKIEKRKEDERVIEAYEATLYLSDVCRTSSTYSKRISHRISRANHTCRACLTVLYSIISYVEISYISRIYRVYMCTCVCGVLAVRAYINLLNLFNLLTVKVK